LGGVSTPLIKRNTTIPTSASQVFSTAADNQTSVEINVLQGEREMAADNKSLGRFILDGIPPAPRGVPQVEVTFDIDANGILNVTAKDKATNKEQKITIQGSTGLSDDEIEKMVKDAEQHATQDKERREKIDTKNMADSLCYTAEKSLRDAGDKVPEDVKNEIEREVKDIRDVLETASVEELKQKTQDLSMSLQKIGQHMYGQEGQPQQGTPDRGPDTSGHGGSNSDLGSDSQNDGSENNTEEGETVEGEVVN
jgi:molecular chaperone DnaK